MEEDKKSSLLSAIAIIVSVSAVIYFAFRGKSNKSNSGNTTTPSVVTTKAATPALMGLSTAPQIIAAVNSGQIPAPPQATGWYWNGSEWYPNSQSTPVPQQYIPRLNTNGEIPARWTFKAPLTISGNTAQGVPVTHSYNTGDVVEAFYNAGATPITPPPAGTPNMGSSLTWSDANGNFMLAGDTTIDTYLLPPLI